MREIDRRGYLGRTRIVDRYSDGELLEKLKTSDSFQGFIESLGYATGRSQIVRRVVIERLEEIGIDHKDFLKSENNPRSSFRRIPDEEYYINGDVFRGNHLARRVKKDKVMEYRCSWCGLEDEWNGKRITLHLDHIDGNSYNNELSNLRWLCPNCHSQTDTYTNRNGSSETVKHESVFGPITRSKGIKKYDVSNCLYCNDLFFNSSNSSNKYCNQQCYRKHLSEKSNKPSKEELYDMLLNSSFVSIGRKFNVTDNTIRKWCKRYGIPHKAKYYRDKRNNSDY